MKMWSRGLGKTELKMDCRYYQVESEPGSSDVFVIGKITDPVNWEFRVTVEPEDIPGMMKLFFTKSMLMLVAKNTYKYFVYLFNRKKYEAEIGPDLNQKVNDAYKQMMTGRQRPTISRVTES